MTTHPPHDLLARYQQYCGAYAALETQVNQATPSAKQAIAGAFREVQKTWDAFIHGTPVDGGHMEDGLLSATQQELKPLIAECNRHLSDATINGPHDLHAYLKGEASNFKDLAKRARKSGVLLDERTRLEVPNLGIGFQWRRYTGLRAEISKAVSSLKADTAAARAEAGFLDRSRKIANANAQKLEENANLHTKAPEAGSTLKALVHNGEQPRYLVLAGGAALAGVLAWNMLRSKSDPEPQQNTTHQQRLRTAQDATAASQIAKS